MKSGKVETGDKQKEGEVIIYLKYIIFFAIKWIKFLAIINIITYLH